MIRRLLGALSVSALTGCAVLTVDVDVYKGPLINSERMKIEHLAAISMAAKPLLIHLRSIFEQECEEYRVRLRASFSVHDEDPNARWACLPDWKTPTPACGDVRNSLGAVRNECLGSWQGRRVNGILSLYEDGRSASITRAYLEPLLERADDLLRSAGQTRQRMLARGSGKSFAFGRGPDPMASTRAYVEFLLQIVDAQHHRERRARERDPASALAAAYPLERTAHSAVRNQAGVTPAHTEALRGVLGRMLRETPEGEQALQRTIDATVLAWTEALQLLATPHFRRRAQEEDVKRVVNVVAEFAARFTDPVRLSQLMHADAAGHAGLERLQADFAALRLPVQSEEEASRLRELLAASLAAYTGERLAQLLLELQPGLRTPGDFGGLANVQVSVAVDQYVRTMSALVDQVVHTGLERGRREHGIETLVRSYMQIEAISDAGRLNGERLAPHYAEHVAAIFRNGGKEQARDLENLKRSARNELLDLLVDYGHKVSHMANLQPLLPNPTRDQGKRIQMLQAIGNSVINQIDDYKKLDAHKDALRNAGEAELLALRNAHASLPGVVIASLARDIAADGKQVDAALKMHAALLAGDARLREAEKLMHDARAKHRQAYEKAEAANALAAPAGRALGDPGLGEQIDKAAAKAASDTEFRKVAEDVLRKHAAARAKEEKSKENGGRAADYEALEKAFGSLLKEVRLQRTAKGAGALKTFAEALAKPARDASAEKDRLETLDGWLSRVQLALAATLHGPASPERGRRATALTVLDSVLGELEYARLIATRAGQTALVADIDRAIAFGRHRRSNMLYVRPASIYLRDSYPATVLQRSPNEADAQPNLIWSTLRAGFKDLTPDEDLAVRATIDKQFWQAVNQIKVSGGGETNYVVAKDDVGNWYVKGVDTKADRIFESMRGLALFHFGPSMKANLLANPTSPGTGTGAATDPGRSVLGRQLEIANAEYVKEARGALEDARKAAQSFHATLLAAAKKRAPGDVELDDAFKPLASDGSKDGSLPAEKVIETLGGVLTAQLDYFKEARQAISRLIAQPEAARPVVEDMHAAAREAIGKPIARVEAAGTRLEQRLVFIDEVAGAGVAAPN